MGTAQTVAQGIDLGFQVQLFQLDADNNRSPATSVFTSADTPSGVLWSGSEEAILCQPTVSWVSASAGTLSVALTAAQTAALDPGTYELRAIVATAGGQSLSVWEGAVEIEPSPGVGTTHPIYGSYQDLLRYAPWLSEVEERNASQSVDLAGFLDQRAAARAWLDRVILNHAPNLSTTPYYGSSYGSGDGPRGTNQWVSAQLANNLLMKTQQTVEIVSRRALAVIADSMLGPGKEADQYRQIAGQQYAMADALACSYVAEIDLNSDGYADVVIDCGQVSIRGNSYRGYF